MTPQIISSSKEKAEETSQKSHPNRPNQLSPLDIPAEQVVMEHESEDKEQTVDEGASLEPATASLVMPEMDGGTDIEFTEKQG